MISRCRELVNRDSASPNAASPTLTQFRPSRCCCLLLVRELGRSSRLVLNVVARRRARSGLSGGLAIVAAAARLLRQPQQQRQHDRRGCRRRFPIDSRHTIDSEAPTAVRDDDADADRDLEGEREAGPGTSAVQTGVPIERGLGRAAHGEAGADAAERAAPDRGGAHHSEPTAKTTASISSVPLRPRRSESQLQVSAPITAPSRMLAAMTCFPALGDAEVLRDLQQGAEMMPVS